MKSLMCLVQEVLLDRGTWCGVSTTFDLKRIESRVKDEGLSFLTITLPTFGKDLEKGLDQGFVDRRLFQGFPWKAGLPLFLGGFLDLVFDRKSGRLLDDPSIDAIQAIRQITLMFAKISLPCTPARERKAIEKFLQCEQEIREVDKSLSEISKSQFHRVSGLLWADVLQQVDEDIYYGRLVPKHGPGATADKLTGNRKYNQSVWTTRLEEVFPHMENLASSWRFLPELQHVNLLEPGEEIPVRVITVPKTLKTPRIIAVEPTCMQYAQQAIMEAMVTTIEDLDKHPFSGIVGFTDQRPNQVMAKRGSHDGSLATLDLSEASDRVSNQLVRLMTEAFPNVAEGFDATRSRKADVPGHGVIRLAKFASMGSALCFPVEAMVFSSIVFCGIEDALSRRLSRADIKSYSRRVRVYGDDIIIPVEFAHAVVQKLEDFGLRVNSGKSFWTGKFRESCGKEYYDGHDVSIVKVRTLLPASPQHTPELISSVSFRNQMYQFGYWRVARYMDELLRVLIPFPTVASSSSVLGRHSFLGYETQKVCSKLHSPLVKGHVVTAVLPRDFLDGYGALMKWFLKRGVEPFADRDHLERAGRPRSVHTKTRWARPF